MRDRVTRACKRGAKRGQRGIVYFITADKNIQAVKTGAAIGVIGAGIRSFADGLNIVLAWLPAVPTLPVSWIAFTGMVLVFYIADYADENTEAWRALVEEATGEDAAGEDSTDGGGADGDVE